MKYNYTYEEYSQDTRSYEIESDVKLTQEAIQDIALGCDMTDGYTYLGGEKNKRFQATFKGTEFGDDSQTEYGGDDDVLMSAENVIGIFQTESSNKGYSKEEIEIWSNTLRHHLNEYIDHISSKFN